MSDELSSVIAGIVLVVVALAALRGLFRRRRDPGYFSHGDYTSEQWSNIQEYDRLHKAALRDRRGVGCLAGLAGLFAIPAMLGLIFTGISTRTIDRSDGVITFGAGLLFLLLFEAATPPTTGPKMAKWNRIGSLATMIGVAVCLAAIVQLLAAGVDFGQ